jgi:hypothetical protein
MDARLKRLFDEAAIRDVMASYARGIDRMDRALIEGAYWPDGYDRHAHFGGTPAEFTDWVMGLLADDSASSHLLGQSLVRFEGNQAAVETYYFARHVRMEDGVEKVLLANCRYADLFEERGGEWRILTREVIVDWGQIVPMGEKQSDDLLLDLQAKGQRSPNDFSSSLLEGALDRPAEG